MNPYVIISLFVLFIVKHFLCDYVLQYSYMVQEKGIYGATGGVHHAGIHALMTSLILLFFVLPPVALLAGVLDGLVHYHIDWAKQTLSKNLTSRDRKFWIFLGFDQTFHYLTYALIIGLIVYE